MQKALYFVTRALYSVQRAIYSEKRALSPQWTRAVVGVREQQPIFCQTSPVFCQKSPTFYH